MARALFVPTAPGDPDAWLALPPADFVDGDGGTHAFVASENVETFSLRVAPRARPYQPGAKLDETSHDPDEFELTLFFHPDINEPGADVDRWPGAKQRFLDAAHTGKTGTLNLPWKRGIRCKCVGAVTTARSDELRGGELMRARFKADNEDNLDRAAFVQVSVKASLPAKVEAAQFDAESEGMDLLALEDITELAANVVGLLNSPADVAAALLHAGNRLRLAVKTVATAFSSGAPGHDQMNSADAAGLLRAKLLELAELGARAQHEGRPRPTRTMIFDRDRDIWSIANELRPPQSARELMTINEKIEDFAFIPAGTPVRVFV